jgi:hypothetical protein
MIMRVLALSPMGVLLRLLVIVRLSFFRCLSSRRGRLRVIRLVPYCFAFSVFQVTSLSPADSIHFPA